jgi:glycerophosphoryl diester phosphodiesterase
MRHKWIIATLSPLIAVVTAYGVLTLLARPAPHHPFFAAPQSAPLVIAHRGGAGLRPENTLEAFLHAASIGADVVEMDVQRTADGAIVCLHDTTVDRTTNGRGRVESLTLSELQKLDAGHHWSSDGGLTYPFRGKGVRVPTLEEVLTRLPKARAIIEMKHAGPELARPLCSLIRRSGNPQARLVASMNPEAVAAFRQACPEVATAMTSTEARAFYVLHRLRLESVYSPPVQALLIPDRLRGETVATRRLVRAARGRSFSVHVWTVNDAQRMRELLEIGVSGIITDRPDLLLKLLGRA